MKRTIISLLTIVLCVVSLMAETIKRGDLYYSLGSTTATVVTDQNKISGKNYSTLTSVEIPSEITWESKKYTVTTIGSEAFLNATTLLSVTLPSTITSINSSAFKSCDGLIAIELPEALISIGSNAFDGCVRIEAITIPVNVTTIGQEAFQNCENLETVVWNAKNVTSTYSGTGYRPFYNCAKVKNFTFGDQVQRIPQYLCYNMSKLMSIALPNSVTTIGSTAFESCTGLCSLTLPESLTSIPDNMCKSCSNLESIKIPSTVTSIGSAAFKECTKLMSIELPAGLKSVYSQAFDGCSALTELTIPEDVTTISTEAFQNCTGLKTVVWNAKNVTNTYSSSGSRPFYACSNIESFTFGDQVQTIPQYLCYNLKKLTSITLPNSVTTIKTSAFESCTSLSSLTLPENLTYIPDNMCMSCSSLESIKIPSTVTSIGSAAFKECTKLQSIEFPTVLKSIYSQAFDGCTALTELTIPEEVTTLSTEVFQNCTGLKTIVWNAKNVTSTYSSSGSRPLYGCSNIESFTFGDQVQTIPQYLCYYLKKLTSITLPNSVTTIKTSAFESCTGLSSLTLPENLTYIPDNMCKSCSSLKSIDIPKGVTSIGSSAFNGCVALELAIIPSTVSSIYTYAFSGCESLAQIYNYSLTPQTINANVFENVDKQTCYLYVPGESFDTYSGKAVWNGFVNMIGMKPGLVLNDYASTISYLDDEAQLIHSEPLLLHVPVAPKIDGFTFIKWEIIAGDLSDGVHLQAVYTQDAATGAPASEVVNPANTAQKLIRQGNVYILTDTKTYSVHGMKVQ